MATTAHLGGAAHHRGVVDPPPDGDTVRLIGAGSWWDAGHTGQGVDVAVVDTGVAPLAQFERRLVAGVDLTGFGDPFADRSGHGTHLASLIAGVPAPGAPEDGASGVAPSSRIVSVKVADHDLDTDIEAVIAGLEWVLSHGRSGELRVRVVNLAFCATPRATYRIDPLARAVEQLWHEGIVVVASAGNVGGPHGLASPAYDPFVIAVGAADELGHACDFSTGSRPDGWRTVDLLAPGRSVRGARAPGSLADQLGTNDGVPIGVVRGSGTSQAAALVAGAAALVLGAHPDWAPDSVKHALVRSARPGVDGPILDLHDVITSVDAADARQGHPRAMLPLANARRGSHWAGSRWAGSRWAGSRWAGSRWA
ncbi:MAG: S8 family serine peptidase [Acidimicrobiia bacterium]